MAQFLFWGDLNSGCFPPRAIATYWLTAAGDIKPSSLNGRKCFDPKTPASLLEVFVVVVVGVFFLKGTPLSDSLLPISKKQTGGYGSSASCETTESSHRAVGGHLQCKYLTQPQTLSCRLASSQLLFYRVAAEDPCLKGGGGDVSWPDATSASPSASQVGRALKPTCVKQNLPFIFSVF